MDKNLGFKRKITDFSLKADKNGLIFLTIGGSDIGGLGMIWDGFAIQITADIHIPSYP